MFNRKTVPKKPTKLTIKHFNVVLMRGKLHVKFEKSIIPIDRLQHSDEIENLSSAQMLTILSHLLNYLNTPGRPIDVYLNIIGKFNKIIFEKNRNKNPNIYSISFGERFNTRYFLEDQIILMGNYFDGTGPCEHMVQFPLPIVKSTSGTISHFSQTISNFTGFICLSGNQITFKVGLGTKGKFAISTRGDDFDFVLDGKTYMDELLITNLDSTITFHIGNHKEELGIRRQPLISKDYFYNRKDQGDTKNYIEFDSFYIQKRILFSTDKPWLAEIGDHNGHFRNFELQWFQGLTICELQEIIEQAIHSFYFDFEGMEQYMKIISYINNTLISNLNNQFYNEKKSSSKSVKLHVDVNGRLMDLFVIPNQIHSIGRVDFNFINLSKCLDKDPAIKNIVPRVYAMVKIENDELYIKQVHKTSIDHFQWEKFPEDGQLIPGGNILRIRIGKS